MRSSCLPTITAPLLELCRSQDFRIYVAPQYHKISQRVLPHSYFTCLRPSNTILVRCLTSRHLQDSLRIRAARLILLAVINDPLAHLVAPHEAVHHEVVYRCAWKAGRLDVTWVDGPCGRCGCEAYSWCECCGGCELRGGEGEDGKQEQRGCWCAHLVE